MSTEERIKQEAELIPEKLGWVNDGTSEPQDIKRAYALGALSERNKVIEEVISKLDSLKKDDETHYFHHNQMFKIKVALQSLKV